MKKYLLAVFFTFFIIIISKTYSEYNDPLIIKQVILNKNKVETQITNGRKYTVKIDGFFIKNKNNEEFLKKLLENIKILKNQFGNNNPNISKNQQLLINYIESKTYLYLSKLEYKNQNSIGKEIKTSGLNNSNNNGGQGSGGGENKNKSCIFNNVTINHNSTKIYYEKPTVPYGNTCKSETRTCNNAVLSGSYGYTSCNVESIKDCSIGNIIIKHGDSKTFYQNSSVPYGSSCDSIKQTRTCNNAVLSGSYGYTSCNVESIKDCSIGNIIIKHGDSKTFYKNSSVLYGSSCDSIKQTRTCNNGVLWGNDTYNQTTCSNKIMRVLDWNLLYDGGEPEGRPSWENKRKNEAITLIKAEDPDIMLLQEISQNMYGDIKNAFPEYKSHWVTSGSDGRSSNAIFSKLPMTNLGYFYLHYDTNRTCPYATIDGIKVYSCHMPPPGVEGDTERQQLELPRRITSRQNIIAEIEGNALMILGGDMNTQKRPYDLKIYETVRLENSACGVGGADTQSGIDFVFSSHACTTETAHKEVQSNKISDHPAIVVAIDFSTKYTKDTPARRDRYRKSHINTIANSLVLHYKKYGSYTQPESGRSDCSTGMFNTNRYCCNSSDCQTAWSPESNLQTLVNDGFLNSLKADPINNKEYFYRYEPFNKEQEGGTHDGWKYELCAEKFETHRYDTESKDFTVDKFCRTASYGK